MTQYDQHQSAPPAYPGGQPTYGEPAYGQPGFQPQKTNTMAILGLVFAFVFSPLGIVFSAIGLKQIKERREGGRGLALAGLILSIVFVLIGILFVILAATVFSAAVEQASQDAATVSDAAAPPAEPTADVDGVVAACEVIVPAVVNLEADLANVQSQGLRGRHDQPADDDGVRCRATTDPTSSRTCRRCRPTSSRRSTP